MRGARAAIEAGRYAAFAAERLAALDRHEHDPARRPPGRRSAAVLARATTPTPTATRIPSPSTGSSRFEIVLTSLGVPAVRDEVAGEVMHPVIGPAVESERLYVGQSRLRERLAGSGPRLVLFDVGLGAGSNALAAFAAAEATEGRPLEIVSFELDTGALALAASDSGAALLGLSAVERSAIGNLLAHGRFESARVRWRLVRGDVRETLPRDPSRADVVFWDPYSPRANPELWTVSAFAALRARCAASATVYTYGAATGTRAAFLLAGFFVGAGDPSGPKAETTAAATDVRLLTRPLDARWLARLDRSSSPLPQDAPPDALDRIRAHPQFVR
jgi:queuine tRNA-ribosyltransferase